MKLRTSHTSPSRRASAAPWRWAVAGALLGTCVTTVAFAPARWLAQAVAQVSAARVQLLQPQGTVWRGSAQLVLGAGSGSQDHTALPGRVQWGMGVSLQGGTLALEAPCCLPQPWIWTIQPQIAGVKLDFSDLPAAQPSMWPSTLLAGLGTPWNTLQLEGTLALSTRQLSLQLQSGQWLLNGQAQLDASNLSTSLSTLRPMGSYRLGLTGGATPTLDLSTLEGSLLLSGSGRWVGGRLRFDGQASAAPGRADALGNLLNIIGRRDGARTIITVG